MNEEISNSTAITLAAAVTIGILALLALLLAADQDNETHKSGREIKAKNCPVQVTTACGVDICQYTAHAPCAELEDLIRKEQK